jgi:hypothetical protein
MAKQRTAQEVIDQAIRENRFGERLLYGFACLFVGCGITTLLHGIFAGAATEAVLGAVGSSLFYPAMHLAKQIRHQNIAIRLLEASLARADTAQDAASAIRSAFRVVFTGKAREQKP